MNEEQIQNAKNLDLWMVKYFKSCFLIIFLSRMFFILLKSVNLEFFFVTRVWTWDVFNSS